MSKIVFFKLNYKISDIYAAFKILTYYTWNTKKLITF